MPFLHAVRGVACAHRHHPQQSARWRHGLWSGGSGGVRIACPSAGRTRMHARRHSRRRAPKRSITTMRRPRAYGSPTPLRCASQMQLAQGVERLLRARVHKTIPSLRWMCHPRASCAENAGPKCTTRMAGDHRTSLNTTHIHCINMRAHSACETTGEHF